MKFGINTFLFTSPFTNESVSLFPLFRQWGYDSVEIALEDPANIDPERIRGALTDQRLVCGSVCAAMGPDRDLRGTEVQQATALHYLTGLIDRADELGSTVVGGPLYSSVGRAGEVSEEDYRAQWNTVVKHLRQLCAHAASKNVVLAIEPLNRFETDFINTCAQGLQMIEDVNSPTLKLHLDTFHMNIEEKDPAAAVKQAGAHLGLFHASGSDRGTPGSDHLPWASITHALKAIDYRGDIVIESFTKDVKVIARAAAIWRKIEPSGEDIALKGLRFLKETYL